MRILLLLFLIGALFARPANAAFTTAVEPNSGNLYVLEDGDTYFYFTYYDWGPGWSGVSRSKSTTEFADRTDFTIESTLNTGVSFLIDGAWSNPQTNHIRFDASLMPDGTSELVQSEFGMETGDAFDGTTATVTYSNGTTSTINIPFQRKVEQDVMSIEFTDLSGRNTLITFDDPTYLPVEWNQGRIAIAHTLITSNQVENLNFTIQLPNATDFVPGVIAGAVATEDLSTWTEFTPASPIPANSEWSLSSWLEAPAGKHGRITRQGDQLQYNGHAIKLWGLNNCYASCAPDNALADKRANFYAAMGVNSVRLHKYADGTGWEGILTTSSAVEYDPVKLDQMDYYIAALKQRGIYTKLSPVFIIDIGEGDRDKIPYMDEFGTMSESRINPKHGSLFFSVELQDLLIEQMVNLLVHTNAYTGLPYAEDPAIAYIEIYNEDSAFFYGTPAALVQSPTLRARSGVMFSQWLKDKYGTETSLVAAWGASALNNGFLDNQKLPQDESWDEDRIYPAGNPWFFDPDNLNSSTERRFLDTMVFLYEVQNDLYTRYMQAIRATGYDGEFITSNWVAGRMMSHFYNLHSDLLGGTIDRHNYFGGKLSGMNFNSTSMLSVPGSAILSSSLQQVKDHPFMFSEWIHVFPNEWGVEGPAIIGAYGMGLQGWDVSYAFQNSDDGTFSSGLGGSSWDVTAPQFMGIFPAVSRQVLRGDVSEATAVHNRKVNIAALADKNVGFDDTATYQWDIKSFTTDVFPAEALAITKGVVEFTDTFEATTAFDMTPYQTNGLLKATTGQLSWRAGDDSRDGHIEINTSGTQAIVGFSKDRTADFDDVRITQRGRFGAVYLTAQSQNGVIATDSGVLLTAIARARTEGQIIVGDSLQLSAGNRYGPVFLEPVVAEITLKRGGIPTVHILNHSGVKTGATIPVIDGSFTLDTSRDASPYYLITFTPETYDDWAAGIAWDGSDNTQTGDDDGDGIENQWEYAMDLDPMFSNAPPITSTVDSEEDAFLITYRRNKQATGLAWQLQVTTNLLTTWTVWPVDDSRVFSDRLHTDVDGDKSAELMRYRVFQHPEDSSLFFRIGIE